MTKAQFLDKVYSTNLTSRAVTVIFYLVNRANKEMTCFPAIKTIAKECSISERTVRRALKDLVDKGLLKKETRWRENGGQSSNLYTLKISEVNSTDKHKTNSSENEKKENNKEVVVNNQADNEYIDFSFYVNNSIKSYKSVKSKIIEAEDTNKIKADNNGNELEALAEHCSNSLLNKETSILGLKDNTLSIVKREVYKIFIRAKNDIGFYLPKLNEGYCKNKVTGGG